MHNQGWVYTRPEEKLLLDGFPVANVALCASDTDLVKVAKPIRLSIRIEARPSELAGLLASSDAEAIGCSQEPFSFSVPIQLKRRGVEAKLVMQAGDDRSYKPDSRLVAVLADRISGESLCRRFARPYHQPKNWKGAVPYAGKPRRRR